MTGGEILVDGNAGNEIGHTMRRGLIAIGGKSGDATGFSMIAGTVLLLGETGIRLGAGMRRGTIALLGEARAPDMLPTFKASGRFRPVFLRYYLLHLQRQGFGIPEPLLDAEYRRYNGDFLETGKGEVLVRVAS